jgi:hypothetical protein
VSIYELDISWAITADDRRHLRWELLACEWVRGVFLTAREDVLAVLFDGDRLDFDSWARTLEPNRHLPGTGALRWIGAGVVLAASAYASSENAARPASP